MASNCYAAGRIDDAIAYGDAAARVIDSGQYDPVPFDLESILGAGATAVRGRAERWIELCRRVIGRDNGAHTYVRASLAMALMLAGADEEAVAESQCLVAAAEVTDNPHVQSYALAAYGIARRDADPVEAFAVQRRGLAIAQASGNRQNEHVLAVSLARLSAIHGDDPAEALDFLTLAIRIRHDSGSFSLLHAPMAILEYLPRPTAPPRTRSRHQRIRHHRTHPRVLPRDEGRRRPPSRRARRR